MDTIPASARAADGAPTARRVETQARLLRAALRIMKRGDPVTVATAAAEAGMSVATAYRYYSEADTLKSDAALSFGNPSDRDTERAYAAATLGVTDLHERLRIAQGQLLDPVIANDATYRLFLAKRHERIVRDRGQDMHPAEPPARAPRRLLLERALEPIAGRLGEERLVGLVNALMAVAGPEPYLSLADQESLSALEIRAVTEQALSDILDAHLRRAGIEV